MALVAAFDLDTTQYDATNAFLNAFLDEDVYVSLPNGFKVKG
jgi:small nuclear ribonucleoprotein (snRNP)-like protein